MRRRTWVPINEGQSQSSNIPTQAFMAAANAASTVVNESVEEPVTFEELKDGLNLLLLIRDGYVRYKDFMATMNITEDGKIGVGIYSEPRDVISTVTISGKGITDCEAAVDYAIEKLIVELRTKEGGEVNESLKHDIATGALGLAMLGFASGSLLDYAEKEPELYHEYVMSPEREELMQQQAEKRKAERAFFMSKEWNGMESSHEGYIYDKIGDEANGGTFYIMVNREGNQFGHPTVRRFGVNGTVYKRYNIGDYIDIYDVIDDIQ